MFISEGNFMLHLVVKPPEAEFQGRNYYRALVGEGVYIYVFVLWTTTFFCNNLQPTLETIELKRN